MNNQTHSFQAEVAQLLHLVTHSLYSNRDIFLRELVSNASDACDKLRFEALADATLWGEQPELEIRITADESQATLAITDTGIGLSQQEAIEHLGTIAKSGTREFMARLSGDQKSDAQLIGQFGVGFYSAFIVANRVVVESRRAGLPPEQAVRWSSDGSGQFEVETIARAERGTTVTLHLRDDAREYLAGWKLRELLKRYSDHIALPIRMRRQRWQDGEGEAGGRMVDTDEWETVNQASALWTRPKKDITDEQYTEFYKAIAHDFEPPLAWTHNRVEGATEYTQLLYIPARAPWDLWNRERRAGPKLYVRRVFILDEAQALLPDYLRFVRGVIDSNDLPLNVSRELLQESRDVKAIREGCTRRVLALLEDLARADADEAAPQAQRGRYERFWSVFGAVLKEGLGEDPSNRDRIAGLLRFHTTHEGGGWVGLAQYKARMKPGQKAIYYLTADTLAMALGSPQLELFRRKGIEVLLGCDRIDEWAMSFLHEWDGTALHNVAKGAVDLGELQDEAEKKAAEQAAEASRPLVERLKAALKDRAEDVRATTRLVDSPACLVAPEHGMSLQMQRLLQSAGQPVPTVKPVLEVNPGHPLVQRLESCASFDDLAQVLFDQALIADGALPPDPGAYLRRVNALLAA